MVSRYMHDAVEVKYAFSPASAINLFQWSWLNSVVLISGEWGSHR